ncbi:nuclear apoptosis-inducing factor 1-like [Gigantopelta aegis]|uniref:nuclear apoptosis-inducing factor 1-like n=1 Tax=Gigantopelta aegis TaxID=1735272 RepID=UPI001B8875F8|nr:nuclear apoptosis-inducing factor 1-like [Gigantopelta aegis]
MTADMAMETKKRKANWNENELEVLADAVVCDINIIRGKFFSSLTHEKKQSVWMKITEKINAVSTAGRSVEEVKKKWHDSLSIVKKKESNRLKSMRETGGGPPLEVIFKQWELSILQTLSPTAISGIPGAVDTSEESVPSVQAVPSDINNNDSVEDNEDSVRTI